MSGVTQDEIDNLFRHRDQLFAWLVAARDRRYRRDDRHRYPKAVAIEKHNERVRKACKDLTWFWWWCLTTTGIIAAFLPEPWKYWVFAPCIIGSAITFYTYRRHRHNPIMKLEKVLGTYRPVHKW